MTDRTLRLLKAATSSRYGKANASTSIELASNQKSIGTKFNREAKK